MLCASEFRPVPGNLQLLSYYRCSVCLLLTMRVCLQSPARPPRSLSCPRRPVCCPSSALAYEPDADASSRSCTGTVFEKRLIEKYIEENGKDPVTGDELDLEDLLPLKSSRIVYPRPPTLTSIPALLSTFQNEWDSLALETYKLKQQLAQTREELATALYQHDAAVRVIARLTKERDEARDALSKVTVTAGSAGNGEAMAVDNEALPDELAAKVDETHQKYVPRVLADPPIPLHFI